MARIPDYSSQQVRAQPIGAPGFSMRAPDSSGLAQGIQQAEAGVIRYVEQERERASTAAVIAADKQLTEWKNKAFFDPENGVYTRKGSNALNVTTQTLQEFEAQQQKIASGLKTEDQRARFDVIVGSLRDNIGGKLNNYEFQERQRFYDETDEGHIETSLQTAALNYNDPEEIARNQNKMAAVVQNRAARNGMAPEAAQAELLKYNSAMSSAVINRMANDDPYRARSYFEQAQGTMTAEDQVRIDGLITREIKSRELEARQLQAIARAEVSSRIQDAQAAYLQGFDYADSPSRQELIGAYGPEDGAQEYERIVKMQGLSSDIRELRTASPEDQQRLIEQYNPAPDGVAGEGFRQDSQMFGVIVQAVTSGEKEKASDPASYVAKYSPLIRSAIEGLASGDPAAAEAYAAATIAEQQRMGVVQPRLLSNSQVAAIAREFEKTEDGGTNAAEMIGQLQGQWGKYWPDAYKQLSEKLPGAALVIGSGVDEATAATLARIAPLKNEDLKRGLETADVSDGRASLQSALAPLRQTLAQQPGGDRTYATIDREAERLMLAYMGQGNSIEDATRKVTKALIDDKYTISSDNNWRAPVQLDARLIERGTELAIQAIDPQSLDYDIPAGFDDEAAAALAKTVIERDAYWVTNQDETGLVLFRAGSAVRDRTGQPLVRSWQELIGEGMKRPPVDATRVMDGLSEGVRMMGNEPVNPFIQTEPRQ